MRIPLPEQKTFVYEMHIPIRWGDMDVMGHVNNTVYFRFFETIRIEWLSSLGYPPNPIGKGPVLVNAFCSFMRQFEYPDTVLAKMYTSDAKRATFETWVTLESLKHPGDIFAEGGATTMWVDFTLKKSTDLPDQLKRIVDPTQF
jgi:acyl-CoA thioester hydrolase